ncbi:uncharacterized protein [Alexandromys fortis]|uniref:uncharacterized protein isoform X2 n=1 Tax=Alexandromys fortis TaxID=100897 RepID=UPI0021537748|nr:uncharacterized protein LOC126500333 isoform X2 [Microtus fortis]
MWRTHGVLETGTALNRALFPPSLSSQAQQGQYSRPLASDQCSPWFLVPHRDRRQRDRNPGEPEETGRLKKRATAFTPVLPSYGKEHAGQVPRDSQPWQCPLTQPCESGTAVLSAPGGRSRGSFGRSELVEECEGEAGKRAAEAATPPPPPPREDQQSSKAERQPGVTLTLQPLLTWGAAVTTPCTRSSNLIVPISRGALAGPQGTPTLVEVRGQLV